MATSTVHLQTGSSTVRCGAKMRDRLNPDGWDLGTVKVDPAGVTCTGCVPAPCPECGASGKVRSGGVILTHNDARIIARGVTANEAANGSNGALLCPASLTKVAAR